MRQIASLTLGLALLVRWVASQTAAPQTAPTQDLTLRFDVDLVQVDAVVTDRKGNHVADLTADEFEVLQDGRPQTIRHFAYVAPQRPSKGAPAPAASRPIAREQVRRTIVLLIDDWEMHFPDFVFAQRALTRYVDRELAPGDLVGVVRTSGGSSAMQQLSADPEYLRTVLRGLIWRPATPVEPPLLRTLRQVVWGLRAFPGRKSIILISPGILVGNPGILEALRVTADLASRSSVTIHTIDCRGLPAPAMYEASQAKLPDPNPHAVSPLQGREFQDFLRRASLTMLADMTAGLFQKSSNDTFGQVRTAAEDSEGYYLIGWYPGAGAFAGMPDARPEYHHLQIKVKRNGLNVRTRRGYYAVAGVTPASLGFSPKAQLQEALFSPFQSSEIAVHLTPWFGYDRTGGAYLESLIHIRPKGIEFQPEGNGCAMVRLEVFASVLPLRWSGPERPRIHMWRHELQICGKGRERALRDGLVVRARAPVEQPGSVQLRVAVRNLAPGEDATPVAGKSLVERDDLTPVHVPVGSAAAVLEIPDVSKVGFALSGISLRGPRAPSGAAAEGVARLPGEGDPAVRQFHPGDPLTCEFEVFGRAANVKPRIQVLHEGKTLYMSEPLEAKPGTPFAGTYKLESSAEPGKYLLGVVAGGAQGKGKGRSISQWVDFEVVK